MIDPVHPTTQQAEEMAKAIIQASTEAIKDHLANRSAPVMWSEIIIVVSLVLASVGLAWFIHHISNFQRNERLHEIQHRLEDQERSLNTLNMVRTAISNVKSRQEKSIDIPPADPEALPRRRIIRESVDEK